MAKISTIEDYQQAVVALTVVVEHLTTGLQELKVMFAEHIKGHKSTWYWLIPTLLLVVQIGVTMALLSRGG